MLILFIRVSSKSRLSVAAMATAMVIYLALNASLMSFASWTEIHAGSNPFKRQEWLRYLLPSSLATEAASRLYLTGPSAVRENLLDEDFREGFPDSHIFQGALSLGTLNDLLLGLEYIEMNFGAEALPDVMIIGLTPRFVAEIPYDRPFAEALEIYGTSGATRQGPELAPRKKGALDLAKSRFRWYRKQRARYAVAMAAGLKRLMPESAPYEEYSRDFAGIRSLARLTDFELEALPEAWGFVKRVGLREAIARSLYVYISPYRYHALEAAPRDGSMLRWATSSDSFWNSATAWDPVREGDKSRQSLGRLRELAATRQIRLMLVDLPQNPVIIPRYDPSSYEAYLQMIREELPDAPLLELRDRFPDEAFHDLIHLRLPAASLLTQQVIDFVETELESDETSAIEEPSQPPPEQGNSPTTSTKGGEST